MNLEALRRRHDVAAKKEAERGVGGFSYMKLLEGKNEVRLLPAVVQTKDLCGDKVFFFEFGKHFSISADGNSLNCLRNTFHKAEDGSLKFASCPGCAKVKELFATKVEEDVELAKKIKCSDRFAFLVIDRKEPEKGPKVMEVGPMCGSQILSKSISFSEEEGVDDDGNPYDITDPEIGRDWVIEKGLNPGGYIKYEATPRLKQSELADNDDDYNAWLDYAAKFDFLKVFPVKTADEMIALMDGDENVELVDETDSEKSDKKEEKTPVSDTPKRRRRKVEEPANDDTEKVPTQRKRQRRAAVKDDTAEEKDNTEEVSTPAQTTTRRRRGSATEPEVDDAEPEPDTDDEESAPLDDVDMQQQELEEKLARIKARRNKK